VHSSSPAILDGPYGKALRRAGQFFMKQDPVYRTMRRLARRLAAARIDYAVVGGMAVAEHGLVRVTQDVDILLTHPGLDEFRERCHALGYMPAFEGARKTFVDLETRVRIEILTTGDYPGDGKPKAVVFPDPATVSEEVEGVRLIKLDRLIELKLASGLSAPHRLRDLADVQDLIRHLALPLDLAGKLDPSVRSAYEERWRAAQGAIDQEGL
jgi:hypothetical protein